MFTYSIAPFSIYNQFTYFTVYLGSNPLSLSPFHSPLEADRTLNGLLTSPFIELQCVREKKRVQMTEILSQCERGSLTVA